jgi:uncharacterized protein YlxW (UPF0749 family)
MVEPDAPQQAEGLLDRIAETALDDDYYVVRTGEDGPSREFNTVLTAVVLAVFALLVTMAALQTRSDRPATQRERSTLISDVQERKERQASREVAVEKLRTEVETLSASVDRFDPAFASLQVQTAADGATGPGVRVVVSHSNRGNVDGIISDDDLGVLVNGLWYAGAEAIAINGQRIGTLSAIHTANGVINVNYKDVAPPYTVVAIGASDSLEQRFQDNAAGRYWAARQKNAGVQFGMSPSKDLTVPAAPRDRVTIRHAKAIKGDE